MKRLILLSEDDNLRTRVQRALHSDEVFVVARPDDLLPRSDRTSEQLILVDCRDCTRTEMRATIARAHRMANNQSRCAAIVATPQALGVEIVSALGDWVIEVLFADSDSLPDLVRAFMNDSSGTASAAIALEVMLEQLPEGTHSVIRTVLGSGLNVSSVKEVAAILHRDRGTVGRVLQRSSSWTTTQLVDLARASYAVLLLRASTLSIPSIVQATRYGESRCLDRLLDRAFGISARQVRNDASGLSPRAWLAHRLARRR